MRRWGCVAPRHRFHSSARAATTNAAAAKGGGGGGAAAAAAASWVHPALSLRASQHGGRGWVAETALAAGTLVIREEPLAVASSAAELPRAVAAAVASSPSLALDLALLQPLPSGEGDAGSLEHITRVLAVNATYAVNADDFAPFSDSPADPLALPLRVGNGGGGGGNGGGGDDSDGAGGGAGGGAGSGDRASRSPGGVCLPVRRSLLNHSCDGNAATLYEFAAAGAPLGGSGPKMVCSVRTTRAVGAGEEVLVEYTAGLQLLAPTADRRRTLQDSWGFLCRCDRCERSGADRSGADRLGSGGEVDAVADPPNPFGVTICGDPLDVPASRGWRASAAVATAAVERGASGAGEMLRWLIARQRKAADGADSYAEHAIRVAQVRFLVQAALKRREGDNDREGNCSSDEKPSADDFEGRALRRHAGSAMQATRQHATRELTRHAAQRNGGEEEPSEYVPRAEQPRREEGDDRTGHKSGEGGEGWTMRHGARRGASHGASLEAVRALAEQLPLLSTCLHRNHPARIPPLLAAAIVAELLPCETDQAMGGGRASDRLVAEALRVHDVAYGGGVELLRERYGRATPPVGALPRDDAAEAGDAAAPDILDVLLQRPLSVVLASEQ